MRTALILAALLLIVAPLPAGAQERLADIKTVTVGRNRELLVNGKPFIPICSWVQSTNTFPRLRALGFNTFCGNYNSRPPAKEFCDVAAAAGGYAMPHFDGTGIGHRALLMWIQKDEPDLGINKDGPQRGPEEVVAAYRQMKAKDAARPVFMNLTACFLVGPSWARKPDPATKKRYYSAIVKGCDVACFDYYPIYGRNADRELNWIGEGVRLLGEYAGPERGLFCFIETGKGSKWITYERQKDVLPMHTGAETWMALIQGARGILYFTHAWAPKSTSFAPTEQMQGKLKCLNARITRLTPAICAAPVKTGIAMTMEGGLSCHFMATRLDGATYIFAQNIDMQYRAGKAAITVRGLKAGTRIEVVHEDRAVTSEAGRFIDAFGPLAEHVYRIGG